MNISSNIPEQFHETSWILFLKCSSNIFSQNFFSNFCSKFFCRNFPQNFFLEFFSKFFFQIFLSKFFSKFFRHLFRGFRMRDTRVLRAPHAGFFSWLYEFWQKILTKNFEKKIWKKNSVGSSTSFKWVWLAKNDFFHERRHTRSFLQSFKWFKAILTSYHISHQTFPQTKSWIGT